MKYCNYLHLIILLLFIRCKYNPVDTGFIQKERDTITIKFDHNENYRQSGLQKINNGCLISDDFDDQEIDSIWTNITSDTNIVVNTHNGFLEIKGVSVDSISKTEGIYTTEGTDNTNVVSRVDIHYVVSDKSKVIFHYCGNNQRPYNPDVWYQFNFRQNDVYISYVMPEDEYYQLKQVSLFT